MRTVVIVACLGCAVLGVAPWLGVRALALVAMGIVLLPEAHADADDDHKVEDILHYGETVLLPQMTIKEAVAMFENAESDALVVVDSAQERHVIGLLTEQYALRRYSDELDRRRRELSGE